MHTGGRARGPLADDLPDLVLARRAGLGDRDAFAVIFHRHGPGMTRYAVHMLRGRTADAEDAVQATWVRAWLHLDSFRGDAGLRTWLYAILAREVAKIRSRREPVLVEEPLLERADDPHVRPEARLAQSALEQALAAALAELPWRQRASWILRELDGLSYQEIARVLQTSPTVVRGQLHRARQELVVRMAAWR
jgi:RNA polymerase sigma-70 factor (ECF subfamily)